MKKFFTMMVALAFVFGTVGCDDKPKTSPPKTDAKKDDKKEEKKDDKKEEKKEEKKGM